MTMRVAVIGGGIAGCSAAWHLGRSGAEVVVFEAGSQLGGRASTRRDGGPMLDTGAGYFTNFQPELHAAIDALGLRDQVVPLGRTSGFVKGGELGTMTLGSPRSFLRFPFLSWRDKARFAAEMGKRTLQRPRWDMHDPDNLAPYDVADMASVSIAALGESVYHHGIRPGVEPFWFFRCEDASVAMLHALCSRVVDGGIAALRPGMDTLCTSMAEGSEVRLGASVREIEAGTVDGEAFDRVVVAVPAPVALAISSAAMTEPQRSFMRDVRYVPQIHVGYIVRGGWPPACSVLIPIGPGEHDVAIASLQTPKHGAPERGADLISVYLSGSASAALLDVDEERVAAEVWAKMRAEWPRFPVETECVGVWRRREALPIPVPGHYKRAAAFRRSQAPPVVWAGDHLGTPTLEGAFRSGRWAAEVLG